MVRGSVREAETYYKQGLELTRSCCASAASTSFLVSLAGLECLRHRWSESEKALENAVRTAVTDGSLQREQVLAKVCSGDLKFRLGEYELALDLYYAADDMLHGIMDENYINSFEQADTR
jgi:hypothetical protein